MATDIAQPRLLSISEAQAALGGIGRTTLWRLTRDGELTQVHIGARRFITVESIDAFISRQVNAA